MAYSITEAAAELHTVTDWQKTPVELTEDDYVFMIIGGIRRLFVDTNRALLYDKAKIRYEGEAEQEEPASGESGEEEPVDLGDLIYDEDFPLDEQVYILLCAQIAFFKRVATDVNNIVGYTTDALSVTNADKPYANLKDTIAGLENERRIVYYKMVRYTIL